MSEAADIWFRVGYRPQRLPCLLSSKLTLSTLAVGHGYIQFRLLESIVGSVQIMESKVYERLGSCTVYTRHIWCTYFYIVMYPQ